MGILEAFQMAWNALKANKLRAALTLMGMTIGVFAVIASVTAVKVIDVYFEESIQLLGTSTFTLSRYPTVRIGNNDFEERPSITYAEVQRLERSVELPVSPREWFDTGAVRYQERETEPGVTLNGTNEHFLANFGYELSEGRGFTGSDVQYARPVAVITPDIAEELFPNESPVGKEVRYKGQRFEVIGVLESKGSFLGQSFDQNLFAPITRLMGVYGQPGRDIGLVSVQAPSVARLPDAMDEVIGRMRVIRGVAPGEDNNFELSTNESMQRTFQAFTGTLTTIGAGIGMVALLAAGIGIMNIMLVSVTERTREIGVRKAVGARRRDVMRQFLLEAVFLCQVGGLTGIVAGALFGNLLAWYFDISAAFPVGWAIAAVLGVTGIALFFGGYPAWKAARLDPIESLRYE